MYPLSPPALYAHASVVADPRYKARLERVAAGLTHAPELVVCEDADVPALIKDRGLLANRVPMGSLQTIPDPILFFNTFRFDDGAEQRSASLRAQCGADSYHLAEALTGGGPFHWFTEDTSRGDRFCRPCWRIHFQNGCAHKCHYCGLGGLLVTMVNVEDYIAQLGRLIAAHPWQETYLLEDDADVLCLEPELGCLAPIIEYFGTLPDRYLIIHTKSANVDWMLNLRHNGKTIVVWSICGPEQARAFEPNTGSTEERVEAARKAQQAGYVVRYKFKPIIPVRGWEADAARAVELILARTRPDVISLCVFMWMDFDDMAARLNLGALDPWAVERARAAAKEMGELRCRPFPDDVRARIYEVHLAEIRKRDAAVPVSLSTESASLWRLLGPRLGATPLNYVCGCGPNATPGRRTLTCNPYTITAGGPVGGFERL